MRSWSLTLGLYCTIVLSGCFFSEQKAGGEDFPNTVQMAATYGIEQSRSSPQVELPGQILGTGSQALARLARTTEASPPALGDTTVVLDSTLGIAWVITQGFQRIDSLGLKLDNTIWDPIQGNETVLELRSWSKTALSTTGTLVRDRDGDDQIRPVMSENDRVQLIEIKEIGSTRTSQTLILGPGKDLNYDTEADNPIDQAETIRLRAADTLWIQRILAIKTPYFKNADSNLVQLTTESRERLGDTTLRKNSGELWVYPDTTRNRPIRWTQVVHSGATQQTSTLVCTQECLSGTKAQWTQTTLQGSALKSVITLELNLGNTRSTDQWSSGSWSLYNRIPGEDSLKISIQGKDPIAPGSAWKAGRMTMDLWQSKEHWTLEGVFDVNHWTSRLKRHSDGKTWEKTWDRNP